ncbi:uncharacterized protein LOC106070035 [Biomphalaria glabrata]|uniref:Uncharacterized protein LOC106070035 n=1 Tax=Biomphalaria glabrata TaxID=6526 RepID=A0A9W2YTB7_BIOGL|nr:uncharacterized protein LOC106070035 [Biomphalaria glabrata]
MAGTYEVTHGHSHDVFIVLPSGGERLRKLIYSVDLHGSDYTVRDSKIILFQELSILDVDNYDLVIVRSDNTTTLMNDAEPTIDYLYDLASDAYIKIQLKSAQVSS